MEETNKSLLDVKNLTIDLMGRAGPLRVVSGVSFAIQPGEVLGLVGESGCGKSMTAMSLMRLLPPPPAQLGGQVLLEGRDLMALSEQEMRRIRGSQIAMIFQEPTTSLDPVFTIGQQMIEAITAHRSMSAQEGRDIAVDRLEQVGIASAAKRLGAYPHQLSGGMRQRVMIAMALALHPKVLLADEPTTALDVTVQAQILELILELQRELHMGVLLITHNLALAAEVTDRVAVMYAGEIVEMAPTQRIFTSPRHPYTQGLLDSIPRLTRSTEYLPAIQGRVPDLRRLPPGCRFAPRCRYVTETCEERHPELERADDDHVIRCWNPQTYAG